MNEVQAPVSLQVYHQLNQLPANHTRTAVAIGNFDGVHLGHAAVLKNVVKTASMANLSPAVLTFFPHPLTLLKPTLKLESLTTSEEKLDLLEKLGIQTVLVTPFDQLLASLSPKAFYDRFLLNGLRAGSIHVGADFCFGQNRAGNIDLLQELSHSAQSSVVIEPALEVNSVRVSSSLIRKSTQMGDMEQAQSLLGRPYSVSGPVVHGDGRGKTIGIPTANILFPIEKVLPKSGVYVTEVVWQKQALKSVTNVGVRPTFGAQSHLTVETHILDFTHRIYDEYLELRFLKFIRAEKRFSGAEALIQQIRQDIDSARQYVPNYTGR